MRILTTILAVALLGSIAFAGNTGKIAGTIKDKKTGEPLIGVNVKIEGQPLGAATDFDGRYSIINIPPGPYVLVITLVGYQPVRVTDVMVKIDLTTTIDIEMTETVLELGQEVIIVAERPLVQKDLTATTAIIGGAEIDALPVTEVGAVLNLQAGFVAGSLRGGRSGEVAYWVDGVPLTDAFNGSQVVEVNKSLVQEMQLISGAFNAEYGQAMSGIVNIATREGGTQFKGGIGVYGGDYLVNDANLFPGISFDPTHIRNIEGNVSGPVFGDDLTFFANARYIYFDGYLKGYRRFNPDNIAYTDSLGRFVLSRDESGRGDSSVVPMNWSKRTYLQGKLTWRIASGMKLTGNYIFDYNVGKAFNRSFFYNPDGIGNNYNTSHTFLSQFTHTLSNSTFYTIGASLFDKNYQYYLYDLQYQDSVDASGNYVGAFEVVNPSGPRYVHPKLFLSNDSYSFLTGGTDLGRYDRTTTTGLVKVDVTSQVDQTNLIKAGVEVRKHRLNVNSFSLQPIATQGDINLASDDPYIRTYIPDVSSNFHDRYTREPFEFSAYLQDKIEFKDIIVNVGVRYDYFEPDGFVLNDPSDPSIYNPIKPQNRYRDVNGNGVQDPGESNVTLAERESYWYKKASAKAAVSPRLGVSFPVTERGIVHFSYGHFFQIPRFERLYENPYFKIGLGTGNQGVVGNADLEPEQTISGEIGLQQQLTDDISVDVTAYLRDIRNLTGTRGDQIVIFGGSASYSRYTNSDFGFIKGIVLTLDKRFAGGLNASLDYTYQVAKGSASDPQEARNAVSGGLLPEVQLNPLGWDQRHTLNISVGYTTGVWGVSSIAQYG
ncbi:MAG: TonB-dependent receptor, partial [Bacteroidetes bacterium]|nr:TonB-dependent receptor [Bacteroidota bacterium]